MTKHVDQAHIEQYLSILNLKYAEGRMTIAQKLHAISERDKPYNEHAHVRSAAFGYKSAGWNLLAAEVKYILSHLKRMFAHYLQASLTDCTSITTDRIKIKTKMGS